MGRGAGDDGGEPAPFTPARQIGGSFRNSDFPRHARDAGPRRTGVRYAIGPNGRIAWCEVIDPSGLASLDAMTCRVILDRYRFRPARDAGGDPVTEVREEDYSWFEGRR
jgi:periplasmic protein TonB